MLNEIAKQMLKTLYKFILLNRFLRFSEEKIDLFAFFKRLVLRISYKNVFWEKIIQGIRDKMT